MKGKVTADRILELMQAEEFYIHFSIDYTEFHAIYRNGDLTLTADTPLGPITEKIAPDSPMIELIEARNRELEVYLHEYKTDLGAL